MKWCLKTVHVALEEEPREPLGRQYLSHTVRHFSHALLYVT